jgi:hypothetical protein
MLFIYNVRNLQQRVLAKLLKKRYTIENIKYTLLDLRLSATRLIYLLSCSRLSESENDVTYLQ